MLGRPGARKAYLEGRGSRHRCAPKPQSRKSARTATRLSSMKMPYQVNKASMIEKIAELVREKKVEGMQHVQDESDR